ncbi:substrate-binding domain-containing protein [Sphaerisporangium dianthi]|uniref:Substrate-binding domain-containing protein n=1 Tax=Sphaerisporangium dianthi TaxID=1436120 RepID=A0ABV9CC55_9ACTN
MGYRRRLGPACGDDATHHSLKVPGDVSVVGFDDLTPARWVPPPLTTVRQPLGEMGRAAASMVIALAGGEPLPHSRLILTTDLIVRESTTAPSR